MTEAVSWPLAVWADSTVITQAAIPAPAPTSADRTATATASASAQTAVIGISQPNVSAVAAPDAALASSPSTAFTANTATTRVSRTIRSGSAQLADSSQAGSSPGPYAKATPVAATAGASSQTSGWPCPRLTSAPTPNTTTVEISQGSSSDGVVTRARARPGERSSHAAARSSRPGCRRQTSAATPVQHPVQVDAARPGHRRMRGGRSRSGCSSCSSQGGPQQAAGAVGAAFDRAGGNAEQRGDLGDGAVLDVHEAQHVSFRAGQGRRDVGADRARPRRGPRRPAGSLRAAR